MAWTWKCIICERPVDIVGDGSDDEGRWPMIRGGTIQLDFGFGSTYDLMNNNEMYQSCVCDECAGKKHDLLRRIHIVRGQDKWIQIH